MLHKGIIVNRHMHILYMCLTEQLSAIKVLPKWMFFLSPHSLGSELRICFHHRFVLVFCSLVSTVSHLLSSLIYPFYY